MTDSVTRFYDGLADEYHLLFADWDASVRRQGAILDRLIAGRLGPPPHRVLDCACGIGTQAIGLAALGYRVHGTDISPAAVARAQREAARLGVLADDRRRRPAGARRRRGELRRGAGLRQRRAAPADGRGSASGGARDAGEAARGWAARRQHPRLRCVDRREAAHRIASGLRPPDGRQIAFQVWDWDETSPTYTVHQYVVREDGGAWRTHHEATVYRALRRAELAEIVRAAGLREVGWHLPDETGYYQPILTARA